MKLKGNFMSDFDTFWQNYPQKVGKLDAKKVWNKLNPPLLEVQKALEWQIKSDKWQEGYIPNPATYLRQGRWMDEPIVKFNGKAWYESASGIEAKAAESGIAQLINEPKFQFYNRVKQQFGI